MTKGKCDRGACVARALHLNTRPPLLVAPSRLIVRRRRLDAGVVVLCVHITGLVVFGCHNVDTTTRRKFSNDRMLISIHSGFCGILGLYVDFDISLASTSCGPYIMLYRVVSRMCRIRASVRLAVLMVDMLRCESLLCWLASVRLLSWIFLLLCVFHV